MTSFHGLRYVLEEAGLAFGSTKKKRYDAKTICEAIDMEKKFDHQQVP
jgi:hypothetical protein